MTIKKKYNFFLILIIASFSLSLIYANLNIRNFDKNIKSSNDESVHLMIKNDVLRYFSHGFEIKEQIKDNIEFFETGRNNFTKYLYPRIIAIYYLLFDYNLYEDPEKKEIKIGIHKSFLYFQIIFYYLSIIFLYFQLKNKFNYKVLNFTILFLCFEPTLFQYQGAFWSESIFFSIQILIMGFVLNNNFSNSKLFIIGILLALLALQRTNGFYYILPVIIYFYYLNKFNFFKKIIFLLLGFFLLINIVGYHNYKKTGKFFIIPKETKSVLHAYVATTIMSDKEILEETEKTIEFIKNKNIDIDFSKLRKNGYRKYSFSFCEKFDKKSNNTEYLEVCEYLNQRAKKIILSKPKETLKFLIDRSLSFSLLNPFHIYSDHKFLSGKFYYKSDLHKKLLPYRVVYSFFIYIICLFGLINLIKMKDKNLLFYVIISSLYFFSILSWHGNNRYFTPVLIYFSIFFGNGIQFINEFIVKKRLYKIQN